MTLADWKDLVSLVGSLATPIVAGIGVWIGWAGLKKWQQEEPGKRRVAVAEDAVRLSYLARRALREVRRPLVEGWEMIVTADNGDVRNISANEVYLRRYEARVEVFENLREHSALFGVYFGVEAMDAIDEIVRVIVGTRLDIEYRIEHDGKPGMAQDQSLIDVRKRLRPSRDGHVSSIDIEMDAAIDKVVRLTAEALQAKRPQGPIAKAVSKKVRRRLSFCRPSAPVGGA